MLNKQRSWIDIVIFLSTFSLVLVIDRLTKIFFSGLLGPGESLPIISNVFRFTLVFNTGIAFGTFSDDGFVYLIIPVMAVALLIYNIYYYQKFDELDRWYIAAFSLILGGAIGNLTDRILLGHVIDFIDFRVWPVFNFADSAITVGAVIVFLRCLPMANKSPRRNVLMK